LAIRNSTTGSQLARCFLAENGFRAKDFFNLVTNYLANHADVARAVARGDFDAGAAKESSVENDPNLRIIGKYPNIGMVWVARPTLDATAHQAIRACLLAIPSELVRGLEDEVTGFEDKKDSDYDELRLKMKKAEGFYDPVENSSPTSSQKPTP
jgi:ABC-type phosphate/phosphonate transport system substrate-binding protein